MMSLSIALCALLAALTGISGLHIERFDVPVVLRNGTGPVDLSCLYDVGQDEDGLVIQWFYNEVDLIYQWIPPMTPQIAGLIRGRAEYPVEVHRSPRSRATIRLREVTLEIGGNYTCRVSTFRSEASETRSMIVYVPLKNFSISTPVINDTHINLICEARGAWPRPVFDFRIEGTPIESRRVRLNDDDNYETNGFRIRQEAIIEEPETPALLECGIIVPGTDYRQRKNVVYYPRELLWQLASTFRKNNSSLLANSSMIVFTFLSLLLIVNLIAN